MKSILKSCYTAIFAILSSVFLMGNSANAEVDIKVKVNNLTVWFPDAKPYVDPNNNRTMVPVRFVAEKLGSKVTWDDSTKTVTMVRNKNKIVLKVGETRATVNDKVVLFDAKSIIKQNRTFVPLRFVSESFGAKVQWIPENKLILIDDPENPVIEPVTGKKEVTVEPNTTSPFPRHEVTEPPIEEFLATLVYEDGKIKGKIPAMPKGYYMALTYYENKERFIDLTDMKPGETFTIDVIYGGKLNLDIYDSRGIAKNGVVIKVPSMVAKWVTKR